MNKWTKILVGLVLILAVIVFSYYSSFWGTFWNFKHAAWEFFKGGLAWFILLIGVLFLLLGITELRE